jgi:two-component system, OmpR family, sensor kinase
MVADESLRHRLSTQARAVRTRIAVWAVVLTGLALVGAGMAAYFVESDRIDRRISQAVQQELDEFNRLRSSETGRSFRTAVDLMEAALQNNVSDENEVILAYVGGQPELQSRVSNSRFENAVDDPALATAVNDLLPDGGARRINTRLGEAVIAVQPVIDGTTQGAAYVPVYFVEGERAEFEAVMRTYVLVAAIALALVTLGAWLVAGRLLQPLRQMRATAREISDTDLSRRIDTTGNDDITDLGETFNEMLDRLEHAFAHQRRFLDDAGHELRTPITIVRGHLELLDPERSDETEATRDLVLDEVDRMGRLVDDMIVLAKTGRPDFLQPAEADAGILTDEVLDKVRALGDREWKLDERAEGSVFVDSQRVTQALVQLAKNAVQHTDPGDVIAIGSRNDAESVRWWVRDTGPGVPPEDTERIFDRFQRGDRARGDGGSGLGLSIVRAIATAHGGDVLLDSSPGEGATFTLVVPPAGRPEHTEV